MPNSTKAAKIFLCPVKDSFGKCQGGGGEREEIGGGPFYYVSQVEIQDIERVFNNVEKGYQCALQ